MQNRTDQALVIFLAAGLLLCTVAVFFFPAPRLSERENRYLADLPHFSFSALADGSFGASTDSYLTERFPFRNTCRAVRALSELSLGKQEVNGVIPGKGKILVKRITARERILSANLRGVVALEEAANSMNIPLTFAVAPRQEDVRADVLPSLFVSDTQPFTTLFQRFPGAIDLRDISQSESWYRTDHHWSTEGAYRAYAALCPALGITPFTQSEFVPVTVSTDFYGTTDAAAGIPGIPPDALKLYRFSGDTDFNVFQNGKEAPFRGFYDESCLNTRDQYAVFLGGNFATAEISLGENDTRPTLLLIKDSFANSLVPFLARHYRILAVDPRYTDTPLAEFLSSADRVLILAGMQTLGETTLFQKI